MIFSFDFSFQMQFHQNQRVSANVSPLVKWHLLTEECFVGKFPTGSCQEGASAGAGGEERGVSPAPGRTFPTELLWLGTGCQETRRRALPAAVPRCPHCPEPRQPLSGSSTVWIGPRGTAAGATLARREQPFVLPSQPSRGCDEGGNVSHSDQVIHCPGPVLNPPSCPSQSTGRIQSLPSYFYKACSVVRKERVPSG